MQIHAAPDPDPGYTYVKNKNFVKVKKMLYFTENKVIRNIFITNTVIFILFMPNYLSFGCVFYFILAIFRPLGSGSAFGMRIRIRNTASYHCVEGGSDPRISQVFETLTVPTVGLAH
jgi:hypothetical protein